MTTKVIITAKDMANLGGGHEVHENLLVLARLRAAGIPVIGAISVRGVEYGKLTMTLDEDDDFVYEFEGRLKQPVVSKPASQEDDEF